MTTTGEKGRLNAEELANKNEAKTASLLRIGFEYLLAGIMEEYSKIKGYKDIEEFNNSNRISRQVLLAYPFFVALSNGHGKNLYSLFGGFETSQYGPVSVSINNLIEGSGEFQTTAPLQYFEINKFNIIVKDPSKYPDFSTLKQAIENESVNGFNGILFSEILIQHDSNGEYTPLYKTINNGINIIKGQSNNTFFDGNLRTITFQSAYFEILGKTPEKQQMPYEEIDSPRRRPFYKATSTI